VRYTLNTNLTYILRHVSPNGTVSLSLQAALRAIVSRLSTDPLVVEELGSKIECFDNYTNTYVNGDHAASAAAGDSVGGPLSTVAPWAAPPGSTAAAAATASSPPPNTPRQAIHRLEVVARPATAAELEVPKVSPASSYTVRARVWTPSVMLAGSKGAAVVSLRFIAQPAPDTLSESVWVPVECAMVRLGPAPDGSVMVDVKGGLPHGIAYLSRLSSGGSR
jgi:hypothetical protein